LRDRARCRGSGDVVGVGHIQNVRSAAGRCRRGGCQCFGVHAAFAGRHGPRVGRHWQRRAWRVVQGPQANPPSNLLNLLFRHRNSRLTRYRHLRRWRHGMPTRAGGT
jgi:hypothetical protein